MTETPVDTDTDARGTAAATAAVLEAVVCADRMINALTAVRAGLIEVLRTATIDPHTPDLPGDPETEMDLRSVTAELACALHVPHTSAANLMDTAHILTTDLPATAAALAEGAITYRHAQTMVTFISGLDPELRARAETILVPKAKVMTGSAFTRSANRTRDHLDPTPLADRHATAATGRRVHVEPDVDSMAWLHAYLPATTALAIFNRLSDAAATLAHPDDPRTLPQLRADALAAITLDDDARDAFNHAMGADWHDDSDLDDEADDPAGADDSGDSVADRYTNRSRASAERMRQTLRGIRPTVAVTVPFLTLLGGNDPGELEGYGPIDADTARQLCAGATSFLRILTHPHTGAILGVDRDRYTVPADLKSWLRLRDETCRFPGCSRRATRCDIDHITDWAHGGTTNHTNLIHLCRTHHRLKHRTRWTAHIITTPPDTARPNSPHGARVHWTAPSGRTYTTDDATHQQRDTDEYGAGSDSGPGPGHPDHQGTPPRPTTQPRHQTTDRPAHRTISGTARRATRRANRGVPRPPTLLRHSVIAGPVDDVRWTQPPPEARAGLAPPRTHQASA